MMGWSTKEARRGSVHARSAEPWEQVQQAAKPNRLVLVSRFRESQPHNALTNSAELSLVQELCRHYPKCLAPINYGAARRVIPRQQNWMIAKQQNETRVMNFQLRQVLQRLSDLNLLVELDPEDDEEDIAEAREQLRNLCSLLDGLSRQRPGRPNQKFSVPDKQKSNYYHLTALLRHLESSGQQEFVLASSTPSDLALFNFPAEEDRGRAIKTLKQFNSFMDQLKLSQAELGDLAGAPLIEPSYPRRVVEKPPSQIKAKFSPSADLTFASNRLGNCFKYAKAALKALFWNLSTCREPIAHKVLVQLPAVNDIMSQELNTHSSILDLFLTSCPDSSKWQEARVLRTSKKYISTGLSICSSINEALGLHGGLHFHVQDKLTGAAENDLVVPVYNYLEPEHHPMKPLKSLQELIHGDLLTRTLLPTLYRSQKKVYFIGENERRSLVIQLLFGLVMCQGYGYVTATWDSEEVFVLVGADGYHRPHMVPHVSCVEGDAQAILFGLPTPDIVLMAPPTHSPEFTKMAKILLEIGFGTCLESLEESSENNQELWEALWGTVQNMKSDTKQGKNGGTMMTPDMFSYLSAAESCLSFFYLYRKEVGRLQNSEGTTSIDPRAIIEHIVSEQIIRKLEHLTPSALPRMKDVLATPRRSSILLEDRKSPQLRRHIGAPSTQRIGVTLFDSSSGMIKDDKMTGWAEGFFDKLENFRDSYKSFLARDGSLPWQPVRIAVLDTGIDKHNVEIDFTSPYMKDDWCISFVGDSDDFYDEDGHGTHCASLLRKVAPDAQIYVAKVFSRNEFDLAQARNIPKAIRHAIEKWDVDIISMSFGLQHPSSHAEMEEWRAVKADIERAIRSASQKLLFAAAANEGKNNPRAFPSTDPAVFCIHASDGKGNDGGINPHHEYAENNFMTLGIGIELFEGDEVVYKEGTSFATAIAAGMAATILDLTSRTLQLADRSKSAIRTRSGMGRLLLKMSGSDRGYEPPYVAPWVYWRGEYWTASPRGLDKIWADLDTLFDSSS